MRTEQLIDLYRSIRVEDETVDRIIAAASVRTTSANPARQRPQRLRVWLPVAATVAATVALALVVVGLRTDGHHQAPVTQHSSPVVSPTVVHPSIVLPPVQPDTISGVVLDNGQAMAGVDVSVQLQLNGTESSKLKVGDNVPTRPLADVTTNAHGSYVSRLTTADLADTKYQDGPYINFRIDLRSPVGRATWNATVQLHGHHATGLRMVFDLGRATVTVDGHTSPLPMY